MQEHHRPRPRWQERAPGPLARRAEAGRVLPGWVFTLLADCGPFGVLPSRTVSLSPGPSVGAAFPIHAASYGPPAGHWPQTPEGTGLGLWDLWLPQPGSPSPSKALLPPLLPALLQLCSRNIPQGTCRGGASAVGHRLSPRQPHSASFPSAAFCWQGRVVWPVLPLKEGLLQCLPVKGEGAAMGSAPLPGH